MSIELWEAHWTGTRRTGRSEPDRLYSDREELLSNDARWPIRRLKVFLWPVVWDSLVHRHRRRMKNLPVCGISGSFRMWPEGGVSNL